MPGTCTAREFADDHVWCTLGYEPPMGMDAENLAHAWLADGDDALGRAADCAPLVAVLGDRRTGRVVVLRDTVGLGRAYVAETSGLFWVATRFRELIGSLAGSGIALELDHAALALYLSFQYVPYPYTLHRKVRQVPPGAIAELVAGNVRMTRVAAPLAVPEGDPPADLESAVAEAGHEVVELLATSLRRQLSVDAPAMFLSGGMDSSSAAALACRMGVKPSAYTATFEEAEYDESGYAGLVARHFSLRHELVPVTADLLRQLSVVASAFDLPHGDRSVLAEHIIGREAARNGHVELISGEGGDELLGYPRTRDEATLDDLPDEPERLGAWYLDRTSVTDRAWRAILLDRLGVDDDLPAAHLVIVHADFADREPFDRLLFGQWHTWLVDGVLAKDTQVLGAHRLRPVFPFIDPDLARYLAALPSAVRRVGLLDKRFLKAGLRGVLPDATIAKRKHKFLLPFAGWLRRDPAAVRALLSEGVTAAQFGDDVVNRLLDEHLRGIDHNRLIWTMLFLDSWWRSLPGGSLSQ